MTPTPEASSAISTTAPGTPVPYRRFLLFAGILVLCYALPFYDLIRVAFKRDLFSHLPMIPFIVGWLVWIKRSTLCSLAGGIRWPGVLLGILGLAILVPASLDPSGQLAATQNRLPLQMLSFCLLLWSLGFLFLRGNLMRELAFPALFFLFIVPFPPVVENGIEWFLQHASAEVAYLFIQWSGIPVLRNGLSFEMPGISISVAPECSGIRSSWVLLVTSLLAGHLFLRTGWKRALLALFVIPLGIARNAFRILTISLLCVQLDPSWIDSPIHHRGGPIFFVLSLIPFSLLLIWLIKSDKRP